MSSKQLRNDQHTLNDLEFEWIRQYFIQGTKHHELHIWWHQPIQILLQFWLKLQQKTIASIIALEDAAGQFIKYYYMNNQISHHSLSLICK